MKKKFYITTSIAYTNAFPHLGFALELVQADVIARHHRILGEDVFFLTGTDEHGRKVAQSAEEAGKRPKKFCDEVSGKYKKLTKDLNISNNNFIRTTDKKRHWPTVNKIWQKLKENGDINKKKYRGIYCSGCEAFITKKDLEDGKCVIHQKESEIIEEENYFFELSKYSDRIRRIIEKDEIKIIPETRKNEMLSFIDQGLEDISFSRPRKDLKWGIPVPDDDSQTIYCWADALVNYLSGAPGRWPADVHCIGKDIQKFHCLIWPGMLLSSGLPLPRTVFVHGFITVGGQKMSKSLKNVIDPFGLVKKYGTDPVRYFLLREIPSTEDGDFTHQKFEGRYNADLAKGLGNLVSRVVAMADIIRSQNGHHLSAMGKDLKIKKTIDAAWNDYKKALEGFKFNEALAAIWGLISFCDRYIEKERPWEKSKKQQTIVYDLQVAIFNIAKMLQSFLPETSEKIFEQLGVKSADKKLLFQIKKGKPLFPRI